MNNLSILGTHSDAGKSVITLALCNIFKAKGLFPAPFKAQNMSNNSAVCDDNSEIGRAQYFQAESIDIKTSYLINPILLKPEGNGFSQLILKGKLDKSYHTLEYYKKINSLKKTIIECFETLEKRHYPIIAEGAGSPVELNLLDKDLSNTFIASHFNNKIIIVADIEKGGVFASIYGTYKLMNKNMQKNVIGVIINKFKGNKTLFDKGIKIIENDFNIPVLGIIPFHPLPFDMEDSLSLNYIHIKEKKKTNINIALIQFPHISNYNDIDPLLADNEINIETITEHKNLSKFHLVILPGSKNTIQDLRWLKKNGLARELKETKAFIFGICGGYQMMFNKINDPFGIENKETNISEDGLKLIQASIFFDKNKTLKRGYYNINKQNIYGYEIHHAKATKYELYYDKNKIIGTHLHGIFENDNFRTTLMKKINPNYKGYKSFKKLKKQALANFIKNVENNLNIKLILSKLK